MGRRGTQTCTVIIVLRGDREIEVGRASPSSLRSALSRWSANDDAPQRVRPADSLHVRSTTFDAALVLHNHVDALRPIDSRPAHHLFPSIIAYLCIVRQQRLFARVADAGINCQQPSGAVVWLGARLTALGPGEELWLGGHCDTYAARGTLVLWK